MKIFRDIESYSSDKPVILTQGTFDGVHLGHQKILSRLINKAREENGVATLLTFDPHPRTVLYPDNSELKFITTRAEKIKLLEQIGLDQLIILPFTKELSRLPAMNFVRDFLIGKIGMKHFIVGYDHRFGRNREGSFEELKHFAEIFNFGLEEISATEIEECAISSTKIRKAILNGDIETANSYLGREFSFIGKVIHGKKLGKGLGFPTANIEVSGKDKILPQNGVYCVHIQLDGKMYDGMMNIGVNPTIPSAEWSIEVNIFDLNRDLYGHDIEVSLVSRMRNEVKFETIEELKDQIVKDKVQALSILNKND